MSMLDQGLEHPTLSVSPTLLSDSLCMLASGPTTCELSPCLRKHGHQQLWAKRHSKVMIQKARVSLEYQQSWKDSNWPSLDYLLTLGSIIVTTSMMMFGFIIYGLSWRTRLSETHHCKVREASFPRNRSSGWAKRNPLQSRKTNWLLPC